jgi:hypothetical protein
MHARTILVCAAFLAAGCGPHRIPEASLATELVTEDDLILAVNNNNWSDVVIYMLRDGRRNRLLIVTAARSASVALPARYVSATGTIQIVAHRIGGNDEYVSPAVSVRLGRTVELTLESKLARSSVGVW